MAVTSMRQSSVGDFKKFNKLQTQTSGVASGGTSSASEGGFQFEIFTASGTLTVSRAGYFDLALVAGGAGGGSSPDNNNQGGGGGGGGVQLIEQVYLDAGSYPVSVGGGGNLSNWTAWGGDGNPSYIGNANQSFIAVGGGGGGRVNSGGRSLATGGGGATPGNSGGNSTVFGQGYAGGPSGGGNNDMGGGGGGAAEVGGGPGAGGVGGPGGDGKIVSWINTAIATTYSIGEVSGSDVYFGGGGAGGGNAAVSPTGIGGGGEGRNGPTRGIAGTDGTGGGGGSSESGSGGAGGDGVIVVRFAL